MEQKSELNTALTNVVDRMLLNHLINILEENGYRILTANTHPEMYGYNDKDEKEQVAIVKIFIGDKKVIKYEF